jgi:FAD:protein FMN transferase
VIARRRFISIAAGTGLGLFSAGVARALPDPAPLQRWKGIALGTSASITIAHEDAARLIDKALAEIARLEAIFSLYQQDSALSRLNAAGHLALPPFELIELLSICDAVHGLSDGAFDPTVQPLWALHAEAHAAGRSPGATEIAAARASCGWSGVALSPQVVVLQRPGAQLTLNGIAQGYIADKVAALLRAEGLRDVLIDMGEMVALGRQPDGEAWRIGLADPDRPATAREYRHLSERAIATSAPLGTTFDAGATVGHILDPGSGRPGGRWRQVSVIARQAAYADALSTAFCLMEQTAINAAVAGLAETEVVLLR